MHIIIYILLNKVELNHLYAKSIHLYAEIQISYTP